MFSLWLVWIWQQQTYAQSWEAFDRILQKVDASTNPRESLVQRYYSVADLYERVKDFSSSSIQTSELKTLKDELRQELDSRKEDILSETDRFQDFYEQFNHYLLSAREHKLSSICKNNYNLADDRSYAFNLPTALTIALRDMESSCRINNPNGDGIFQIIHNSYPAWKELTLGEIALQFYDFRDISFSKINRHNARASVRDLLVDCDTKSLTQTGVIAPICISYNSFDLDSIIKYAALYNGASYSEKFAWSNAKPGDKVLWPLAPQYVFGGLPDYQFKKDKSGDYKLDKNWNKLLEKDGVIIRVLQSLNYRIP